MTDRDILKFEDQNYRVVDGKLTNEIELLYAFCVSAKRYSLYSVGDDGQIQLRKVTAHGLGQYLPPYRDEDAPERGPVPVLPLEPGIRRWHHDVWYRIVQGGRSDRPRQRVLDDLPGFDRPAASRYAATTPAVLNWFKPYNRDRPYRDQVKPHNFLLAFQARRIPRKGTPQPVSTYHDDLLDAATHCFDRDTGEAVPADQLLTYAEALTQFHLHPEDKFQNGGFADSGLTRRRHVHVTSVEIIGKEADRWEEQHYLGLDPDAQIEYGIEPAEAERQWNTVLDGIRRFGLRTVAREAGVDHGHLSRLVRGKARVQPETVARLAAAVRRLDDIEREIERRRGDVLRNLREMKERRGLTGTATQIGIDARTLGQILRGRRKLGVKTLDTLEKRLNQREA